MIPLFLLCLLSADFVAPTGEWNTVDPEEVNLTQEQIGSALAEWARRTGPDGVKRTVIVRKGRLVHAGPEADRPNGLYSSTKSFTSTALGLLVEDGVVSLDTKAASIDGRLGPLYTDATLRHFTTMTSGYSAAGVSRWNAENSDWSWTPYEPATPHFPPGTRYAYWDEAQMTLGRLITKAAERDTFDLMTERVFEPIGISSASWQAEGEVDSIPIRNGCTWLKMSALDLARFGHLFLNEGRWNDKQVVPKDWVREATRIQVLPSTPVGDTDRSHVIGSGCYGYNWWVNGRRPDGTWLLPDLPPNAYFCAGLKHNVCLIVPEWELVIVRLGEDHNPPDGHAAVLNDVAKRLAPK